MLRFEPKFSQLQSMPKTYFLTRAAKVVFRLLEPGTLADCCNMKELG